MGWKLLLSTSTGILRTTVILLMFQCHRTLSIGDIFGFDLIHQGDHRPVIVDDDIIWRQITDDDHDDLAREKREFDFFGMKFDHPPMAGFGMAAPVGKGYAKLEWKHCGSKNDAIVLRDIHMQPNPIQVPGKVQISFNMEVKENQTAPIRLRVDMKKKIPMLFGIHTWMPVPCYDNGIGSCVIEDICNYKKITFGHSCPQELTEQNITCKCPLLQGNYTVPPIEQVVPHPPADIDPILMEGEFRVKFTMHKGHRRLTCYETNATVKL